MIKRSKNAHKAHSNLQAALDRMLKVLKNPSMCGWTQGIPGKLRQYISTQVPHSNNGK